jgi:hypothetical protein
MDNVIQFPSGKVTVEEVLADLTERVATGSIKHLMVVTMDDITSVKCAMSTLPAFNAVYMNFLQRLTIEALMRDNGMLP